MREDEVIVVQCELVGEGNRSEKHENLVADSNRRRSEMECTVVEILTRDFSSMASEPMYIILPNGRFRRNINRWIKGELLGSGAFGTVYKGITEDIKCANILVDASGSVKIADFGLAKATNLNDVKSFQGSAFWMAPEVVNRKTPSYGLAADIWSLGCTVLEMLTHQCHTTLWNLVSIMLNVNDLIDFWNSSCDLSLNSSIAYIWADMVILVELVLLLLPDGAPSHVVFLLSSRTVVNWIAQIAIGSQYNQMEALFKIWNGIPPPIPNFQSRDARDFILQCLQVNPDNRPTAAQLLHHPFVSN
ncbi:hypothetical protein HHK36_031575 [Tetracentron sinense]|uniref:Protein kinase domain-containing protein n=1 Tax=Tetracentron sinense TaxID=13715 RepID=A0A834YBJ9_TETSI|nr:hypothetical protein HHK36_031575 [Tetracentron sinense]